MAKESTAKKVFYGAGAIVFVMVLLAVFVMPLLGVEYSSGGIITAEEETVEYAGCEGIALGTTALTMTVKNGLNSSSETYDVGGLMNLATIADTTAGAYTPTCGKKQTLKLIRSNADGGDGSYIESVKSEGLCDVKVHDGIVDFVPCEANAQLIVTSHQHGVLEARVYDIDEGDWVYDANYDNDANDYELDGTSFQSTTNATAKAIGANGELNWRFEVRANTADERFTDFYTLILAEAPVATWDTPTVKLDGTTLADVKGTLTTYEEKQFSGYEYIYKTTNPLDYYGANVELHMRTLTDVNPSTDPELDFASAGGFLNKEADDVLVGGADDTSTYAVVYTVQDFTADIS